MRPHIYAGYSPQIFSLDYFMYLIHFNLSKNQNA